MKSEFFISLSSQYGPENLEKTILPKNSWNQINQFHEFFLTKFHFLQFQKWPKINFWTREKFKTAKNTNWFIWFHEFFCLDFFKYSGVLWNTRKRTIKKYTHRKFLAGPLIPAELAEIKRSHGIWDITRGSHSLLAGHFCPASTLEL